MPDVALLNQALDALCARLGVRDQISPDEQDALRAAAGDIVTFAAGADIVREHSSPNSSLLVASGIAARYNLVESGERQVSAFHIAGDFVDLHAFLLTKLDHGLSALTEVTAIQFPHSALQQLTDQFPFLTRMLWLSTVLDGAIHRRWLLAMGRLSALSHMAHLLCEQYLRARRVGLGSGWSVPFDLTQMQLADGLGLSVVHVNRTLQELRRRSLVDWEHGTLTINDWDALRHLGEFDETYLDVKNHRRS